MRSAIFDAPTDIVDLFLARAAEAREHPAIVTSRETVSYGQLEERTRAFAGLFVQRHEPKIFIALPPSVDVYACILAAGLANGFHTPVNIGTPIAKMERILSQLEPDFLVASAELLEGLKGLVPSAVHVDPTTMDPSYRFEGAGTRHKLAYVFFTSGSTGEPKGVMVSRAALAHYVTWLRTFDIVPEDRVAQQPNIAFDISMTDIFGALCYGATLYPLDLEGDRLIPARFIQRHGITVWNSTPSVINIMMQARQVRSSHLDSVRLFNFCGEPLLKEHLDVLFSAVPDAIIQNTYGPTEATVSVTSLRMSAQTYLRYCRNSVALGDPNPGTDIVLENGPSADEGEIVILGPQLADGYWNDSAKTAAAFRPVPSMNGRRGYFTGDWAVRTEGQLYFRERIDSQVKVRGHRIELDEVAAAIRACGYPVACVLKVQDALAAIVELPGSDIEFNERALRSDLAARLEQYAIPERILMVGRLPRNENDKLDTKACAALLESRDGN